jgi:transposase
MRGSDRRREGLFSDVSCEQRVPPDPPLRTILLIVDAALAALSGELARLDASIGRPSIAPEKLLRALLLQAFYSARCERQLIEQLTYNLLFRWFVGLAIDDPVSDATVFTKNRDRLLEGEVAAKFLRAVLDQPKVKALVSDEHSVDGTLIQAWAGLKSFRPRDGSAEPPSPGRNSERDFHGEKRSNATHASTSDPEAKLCRKGAGKEARLGFLGHALVENRHGLVVDGRVSEASGTAERDEAEVRVAAVPGRHRITVGGDKNFDTAGFIAAMRRLNVTPHVAQNIPGRRSAIDGRTTRHPGYAPSQRARKRLEEAFGWIKEIALMRRTRHRGKSRVGWQFTLAAAAYNLIRLPKLLSGVT